VADDRTGWSPTAVLDNSLLSSLLSSGGRSTPVGGCDAGQAQAMAVVHAEHVPAMLAAPFPVVRDGMDDDPDMIDAAIMNAIIALHQAQERASQLAAQAKRNRQRMHPYQRRLRKRGPCIANCGGWCG